jgi:hypothetical protein
MRLAVFAVAASGFSKSTEDYRQPADRDLLMATV